MAKIETTLPLKDAFEWRHKTTLDDAFTVSSVIYHQERRVVFGLLFIALIPVWLLVGQMNGILLGLISTAGLLGIIDVWLTRHLKPKRLFICRDGLGLDDEKSFKTIEFKAIQKVRIQPQLIFIEGSDTRFYLARARFPKPVMDGLIQIFKAEGLTGTAYPYRIYFTPEKIVVEETAAQEVLSVHERFSKKYRYYAEVAWDTLDFSGTKLTGLKRLKDRTAAITFKSVKATATHPSNGAMKTQKTDAGILVFKAFEVIGLHAAETSVEKPFKTLRTLIEDMRIIKIEQTADHTHTATLEKSGTSYTLTFQADALYVGFNAFEGDAWYRL